MSSCHSKSGATCAKPPGLSQGGCHCSTSMRTQREWCALCGEPSISSLQGGVFKLAVVDVSVGPDGEQAQRQLIPLDQGAPGIRSR